MRPSSVAQSLTMALLTTTAITPLLGASPVAAQNLPTGASIAYGSVGFQRSSGTLTINQGSQNAVVNYNSFSIGRRNTVNINQPSSTSMLLNRVTGTTPSTIAGRLNANGQVYLINPNGIAITKTGVVKVGGGFVASSLGMSDSDFLKGGKKHLRGSGASAAVTNAGTITIGRGGYAALIGGEVKNAGTIAVPMGKVGLGSGEMATLDVSGDGFLQVAVPTTAGGKGALVSNSGLIAAAGGTVVLDAATARAAARNAVNISGTIDAHSISGHNGSIVLGGGDGGTVRVSGTLDVAGRGRTAGGAVAVTGRRVKVAGTIDASGRTGGKVTLTASDGTTITGTVKAAGRRGSGGAVTVTGLEIALKGATVDASGATSGGTVKIGGDEHGAGPLPKANSVTIDPTSVITADATKSGNGGDVVVWSERTTAFAGLISAKGGPQGGNGGNVEVSSHGGLAYTGLATLTAAHGAAGTLLLDPYDVVISSGSDSNTSLAGGTYTPTGTSVISNTELDAQLALGNVTITTGAAGSPGTDAGNITVAAPVAWASGTNLTLTAANNIAVNAAITFGGVTGAGLTLNAGNALTIGATIAVNGAGTVSLAYNTSAPTNLSFAQGSQLTFANADGSAATGAVAGQALAINGQTYTLLYTMSEVANVNATGPSGSYALAAALDAGGTTYTTGVIAGGDTTGNPFSVTPFSGTLEGLGHTIANLTIAGGSNDFVGLIGTNSGTVRDLGLIGGSVSGNQYVGGLVGFNSFRGSITQAYDTGAVSGGSNSAFVGGLVGANYGAVTQAYATGAVAGGSNASSVGGLVGDNDGTIAQVYATGAVSGTYDVGGLVGFSDSGTITQAYATGAVSGYNGVGGLVGYNNAAATQVYSTGAVSGTTNVGGLVGTNFGSVTQAYATGAVSGAITVGGLVGDNDTSGTIATSYWDTQSSGQASGIGFDYNNQSVTGRTTAQFQGGGLPGGFDANVWSTGGGLYPYLTRAFPNGVQAVSGTVYTDGSTTLVPLGAVSVTVAGANATLGTATAGANGYYYVFGQPGTIASGASVLAYTTANVNSGTTNAARIATGTYSASTPAQTGVDVYEPVPLAFAATSQATYSSYLAANGGVLPVAPAVPSGAAVPAFVSGAVPTVVATGASFTFDEPVTIASSTGFQTILPSAPLTVANAITVDNGATLGLSASGALTIAAPIAVNGAGAVSLAYDQNTTTASVTDLSFGLTGRGFAGSLTFNNADGSAAGTAVPGQALTINGTGYTLLYSMSDVSGIDFAGLGGNYALAGSLDASGTTYTNGLIGYYGQAFTGTFQGLGHTIANLTINQSGSSDIALFANTGGTVGNLGLTNVNITGGDTVGAIAAINSGTIANSFATGTVVSLYTDAGGLVATNSGAILSSYSAASATANNASGGTAGGLVGENGGGTILQSYATGAVTASYTAGGLAGYNTGNVIQSYATGAVTGTNNGSAYGGLIGSQSGGAISASYATGTVTGSAFAGGLIGYMNGGTVTDAYAAGSVTVNGSCCGGGLIGYLDNGSGTIQNTYAIGSATGINGGYVVGGLIGYNATSGLISNSYWNSSTNPSGQVGVGQGDATGVSSATTSTLQSALPSGFSTAIWGIVAGQSYPYFLWQYPAASGQPQVVSGTAYSDHGTTTLAGGTVTELINGSGGLTSSTGNDGSYYFLLPPNTISNAGSQVLTYTTGASAGAALQQNAIGPVAGLNIYGTYLNEQTAATTLSGASSGLAAAIGGNSAAQSVVNALVNLQIAPTGTSFTVDQAVNPMFSSLTIGTTAAPSTIIVNNTLTIPLTLQGSTLSIAGSIAAPELIVNATGSITDTAAIDVGAFILTGGNWVQNVAAPGSLPAFVASNDFEINGGSFLRVAGGAGTTGSPYQIVDVYGLQGINSSSALLSGSYQLAGPIDASGTATWNGGAGFVPLGTNGFADGRIINRSDPSQGSGVLNAGNGFTGTLDGQNYTISGLTIDRPSAGLVGLIGLARRNGGTTVQNLTLTGASITGESFVGGVVGELDGGTISQTSFAGNVAGTFSTTLPEYSASIGGLVGYTGNIVATSYTTTAITASSASGSVSGATEVGGLVGSQTVGAIANSSSSATVTNPVPAQGDGDFGGLVGELYPKGTISNSFATGNVSGSTYVGGLVGYAQSSTANAVTNSYATGNVVAQDAVDTADIYNDLVAGGLVGYFGGTTISGSYATGSVSSTASTLGNYSGYQQEAYFGGLVGQNFGGTITASYATGSVAGSVASLPANSLLYAGGLAGINSGTISSSYATGAVSIAAPTNGSGTIIAAGGLVGDHSKTAANSLTQSYATGTVSSSTTGAYLGGLVGNLAGAVSLSFATGQVTGVGGDVGGLVGNMTAGSVTNSYATSAASVSGGGAVGGLVGKVAVNGSANVFNDTYAAGQVSGSGGAAVGGLIGNSTLAVTRITSSYYDYQATGATAQIGSGTTNGTTGAMTTVALKAALPSGFSDTIWGIMPGVTYPYLLFQPGVISGTAYTNAGTTLAAAGTIVSETLNGVAGSATTQTDASGIYSFLLGAAIPAQSQIFVSTSGATGGVTFVQNASSSASGIPIYGTYFGEVSSATAYSTISNGYTSAIAGLSTLQSQITALPNLALFPTGTSFTVDQAVNTGILAIAPPSTTAMALGTGSGDVLSQSALNNITASTLIFGSPTSTATITVGGPVATPSTITNLELVTTGAISIGSGASLTNANANGSVTLLTNANPTLTGMLTANSTSGTITIDPITTSTTIGLGSATGTIGLTQAKLNDISAYNLVIGGASQSGAITVTNTTGNAVTLPAGVTNLTLETAGTISLSSSATSLVDSQPNGNITLLTNTTPTLTGTVKENGSNGIVTIAPVTGSTSIRLGSSGAGTIALTQTALNQISAATLAIGNANTTGAVLLGGATAITSPTSSLVLNTTGGVTQTAAIVATNLDLLGIGGAFTLANASNNITTLAGNAGAVVLADLATNLSIGSVFGTSGLNVASLTLSDSGSGGISQTQAISVSGTSSFTTSAANAAITLGSANHLTGAVSLNTGTSGNASLTNNQGTLLGASTVHGNLSVTDNTAGNISQSGATVLTVGGTSAFTDSVSNGTITLGNNNLLSGAVSLTTMGATGNASLTNARATVLGASGIGGGLTLTSGGSLSISGAVAAGATSLTAAGNLTIAAAGSLTAAANDNVVLSATGNFINNGGANAVTVSGAGRWLIYSNAPGADTFGGLDSGDTAIWNTPAGGAVTASGNRYVFAYAPTLTVATVNDGTTYGTNATNAVLADYTITGFQPGVTGAYLGDTAATATSGAPIVTSAGSVSTAGVGVYAYQLGLGTLASGAGYSFALQNAGTFTVNPAALTITANNASKTYGQAASLGSTAFGETGLVNSDTITGVTLASTGAAAAANVAGNPYAISASNAQGSGLLNYTISYGNGALTVNPLAVTLSGTQIYNGTNAVAGSALSVTNLVGADSVTVAGSGMMAAKDVGSQALASLTGLTLNNANYTVIGGSGSVSVTPVTLTYSANAASRAYGAATPALSGTVTGFVGPDTQATATSGTLAFGTTATTASTIGTYAIAGSGLAAANGDYVFVQAASNGGALTINPAALTITANNASKTYGQVANLGTTAFSETGLVTANAIRSPA